MNKNLQMFFKSFVVSFLIFSLLSATIITAAYSSALSVDPQDKASTVMLAVTNTQNKIISISVIHIDPQGKEITFADIPDNTVLGEDTLLQSLYRKGDVSVLKKSVGDLLGIRISRYMIISSEKIKRIIDEMGDFEHALSYPFEYGGSNYAGTVLLNGALARQMFLYSGYDQTSVSYSEIGMSFLQGFLSKYANEESINELARAICENDFCKSSYTDLSEKEIEEYASVLSKYHLMTHKRVEIQGEYNFTSARVYFIPEQIKLNKNIFE